MDDSYLCLGVTRGNSIRRNSIWLDIAVVAFPCLSSIYILDLTVYAYQFYQIIHLFSTSKHGVQCSGNWIFTKAHGKVRTTTTFHSRIPWGLAPRNRRPGNKHPLCLTFFPPMLSQSCYRKTTPTPNKKNMNFKLISTTPETQLQGEKKKKIAKQSSSFSTSLLRCSSFLRPTAVRNDTSRTIVLPAPYLQKADTKVFSPAPHENLIIPPKSSCRFNLHRPRRRL